MNLTTFTLYKIVKACIITSILRSRNDKKILFRKICRHPEVAPKIIWIDDLKASRAISLHSDFRKLN